FRWTAGTGSVGIGDLPGGLLSSRARAVSSDGSVIVGQGNSTSGPEAFRWTFGGGMIGLGDFAGGSFDSTAQGVSANGTVVVGQGNSTLGAESFRWTSGGGMAGLGGSLQNGANGVSGSGLVIVGATQTPEAFRWRPTDGIVPLGDFPGGAFNSRANAV